MAAASSTASETSRSGPQGPIRTCIGCRQRASAAELLRVVVAPAAIGKALDGARSPSTTLGRGPDAMPLPVVPDPRRRIPGRGAWLHPDQRCAELAERRRAYARALRVPGPVDPAAVCVYLAHRAGPRGTPGPDPTSGAPQEMTSNE